MRKIKEIKPQEEDVPIDVQVQHSLIYGLQNIAEDALSHTEEAIKVLAGVMNNAEAKDDARVRAAAKIIEIAQSVAANAHDAETASDNELINIILREQ